VIRVRNDHTGAVEGILPGQEGSVDDTIHGVRIFLRKRWLVPVEGTVLASPLDGDIDPAHRRFFEQEWQEREESIDFRHRRELSDLREAHASELGARDARIAELTDRLDGREQELIASRSLVSSGAARIASLEAEVAQLKRDLDTATAPKTDDASSKSRKAKD